MLALFRSTFGTSRILRSLYTKTETKKEYMAATAAASVAVKIPAPKGGGGPFLHHGGRVSGAGGDHRGPARAASQREHRARDDAAQREAAVKVAHDRGGEVDHLARDPAVGEEVAREDEER